MGEEKKLSTDYSRSLATSFAKTHLLSSTMSYVHLNLHSNGYKT